MQPREFATDILKGTLISLVFMKALMLGSLQHVQKRVKCSQLDCSQQSIFSCLYSIVQRVDGIAKKLDASFVFFRVH